MKYNIWIPPNMPSPEDRDQNAYYLPRSQIKDSRLNYLDKEVYLNLAGIEQDDPIQPYDINTFLKAIKSNPDENEKILDDYLERTGKKVDKLTDKEWERLPTVPLTEKEVEESLERLESYGYIKLVITI